jgi:2-polyprenyl-3-methyl-5-hydroxy-6-metoxy-1,4-benzoquinol methylase
MPYDTDKSTVDNSNYAIAEGEEGKDYLLLLNEIYNPASFKLLEQHVRQGYSVLDLGCGLGLCSQHAAKLVGEKGSVLAIDMSQAQIDVAESIKAKEFKNLHFQKLSIFELENLDQKFDVIYARFLLIHLPNLQNILEQIKKVLKSDGKIIIEDVTGNHTFYSEPHSQAFEEIKRFDKLQFEVEKTDDCYFEQFPKLLIDSGFSIRALTRFHPKLDNLHKRSILTYGLSSIKDALIKANKITLQEYNHAFQLLKELEKREDITIYAYEMGQVVIQLR